MSEKDSITVFCQEFRSISGTVLASKENWGKKMLFRFMAYKAPVVVMGTLLVWRG